jgi:hypothetical protein
MATMYQKKVAARRSTSDITRLAQQYQQEIAAVTGEYETQYGKYSSEAAEKQKIFEEQKKAYDERYGSYLGSAEQYKKQSTDYQKAMEGYLTRQAASGEKIVPIYKKEQNQRISFHFNLNGKEVDAFDLMKTPRKYGYEYTISPYDAGRPGSGLYTLKPLFQETAPVAPKKLEAFTEKAPEIAALPEFDSTEFETKKAAVEQTFKREVGERRAARLGAVSRKATRPLLGGTTP